jgi:hypothetical protein
MTAGPADLTTLFARLRSGDGGALGEIMNTLHTELHALAARRLRDEALTAFSRFNLRAARRVERCA